MTGKKELIDALNAIARLELGPVKRSYNPNKVRRDCGPKMAEFFKRKYNAEIIQQRNGLYTAKYKEVNK